ncbi:nucleotidyltransferase [candidate division KSB1 bacterium]|nr:nucleotidyltransferase [bacterium]NUM69175.1 nucleotidyltransferase [candidate division KSB1 bacterium]
MLEKYLELLQALHEARIRYLVIGGFAAIMHGIPRFTKDLDLAIIPDLQTCAGILTVLKSLRFGTAYLTTPEDFAKSKITIFEDYLRLDVLTEVPGLDFEAAWLRREVAYVKEVPVNLVCLDDLIALKAAAGRKIDLEGLEYLERIRAGKF